MVEIQWLVYNITRQYSRQTCEFQSVSSDCVTGKSSHLRSRMLLLVMLGLSYQVMYICSRPEDCAHVMYVLRVTSPTAEKLPNDTPSILFSLSLCQVKYGVWR